MGYVLPFGQMSFWGATVNTKKFGTANEILLTVPWDYELL